MTRSSADGTGPQRIALGVAASVLAVAFETALGSVFLAYSVADIAMLFLLGVVGTAVVFGYVAALTTTVLSVAALDFFFTAPYYSFAVRDHRYYLTFAIMALVAYVISSQTERIRREASARVRLATERVRLAEETRRAQAEVQNERLRNALLSSVSHDLRAPLAVIKGAATALLQGGRASTDPSGGREYLQTISDEATRLHRLLQNLIDMTALEAGAVQIRKEWLPLEEVIGVALNRLDDQLDDRRVEVQIAPEAAFAAFDATLLEQVFVNLLENAIKYPPPHSPIDIRTTRAVGGLDIEVRDAGPGVPEGQEEAIFEKFYRATRAGIGMGVGLTICRAILTAHGGRIRCENRPEGGASFRFFLPDANRGLSTHLQRAT
jgi:K+-sensing histidine kinase KdpD